MLPQAECRQHLRGAPTRACRCDLYILKAKDIPNSEFNRVTSSVNGFCKDVRNTHQHGRLPHRPKVVHAHPKRGQNLGSPQRFLQRLGGFDGRPTGDRAQHQEDDVSQQREELEEDVSLRGVALEEAERLFVREGDEGQGEGVEGEVAAAHEEDRLQGKESKRTSKGSETRLRAENRELCGEGLNGELCT